MSIFLDSSIMLPYPHKLRRLLKNRDSVNNFSTGVLIFLHLMTTSAPLISPTTYILTDFFNYLPTMQNLSIHVPSLEALPEAARRFVAEMDDATVYAFYGDMGAGKTTFIAELCRALGVDDDDMSSPSFSIINEYRSSSTGELIYHFDLYRLENPEEAYDIGVEDYFDSGALCLLEWPERIADMLPDDTVKVTIMVNDDESRDIITMHNS